MVSPGASGAEKRFFDIFCELLDRGKKIYMIMPSMLANVLRTEYPDRDVCEHIIEIKMKKWSRIGFIYKFHKLLRSMYPVSPKWTI